MSAIHDRRGDERRSPGRRTQDLIAREREARLLRLEDPAAIAAWELEAEREDRARRWRTERLLEIVRSLR